jgi:thioredoxin 1
VQQTFIQRKEYPMTTATATPTTLTDVTFQHEVLDSAQPVLVDFWAPWCGPCRVMAPVIDKLAAEFADRATVGKVNVDDYPALAAQYNVRTIPAFLIFKAGRVVDQAVAVVPQAFLAEKLEAVL